MEVQNTAVWYRCVHPSSPSLNWLWSFHRTPDCSKGTWKWLVAISWMFCFHKTLSQIKWSEKSLIQERYSRKAQAQRGHVLLRLCHPAPLPSEDGEYADGEVPLLTQLHQPLNKRQRESSSAGFCQHSNVNCKVWSCHTLSWYSYGSRTL